MSLTLSAIFFIFIFSLINYTSEKSEMYLFLTLKVSVRRDGSGCKWSHLIDLYLKERCGSSHISTISSKGTKLCPHRGICRRSKQRTSWAVEIVWVFAGFSLYTPLFFRLRPVEEPPFLNAQLPKKCINSGKCTREHRPNHL
jgi:hypothetical protein